MPITVRERGVLRSVVRSQFKVLRAEIEERRERLMAEANAHVLEKYRAEDAEVIELNRRIEKIVQDAQMKINKLRDGLEIPVEGRLQLLAPRAYRYSRDDRSNLYRALKTGVDAKVREARLVLQRREAELIREIVLDDLKTEEAKAFFAKIPTVLELLPSELLLQLEANETVVTP